jgi:branched-chain amino acid transport system substrate-binding protein
MGSAKLNKGLTALATVALLTLSACGGGEAATTGGGSGPDTGSGGEESAQEGAVNVGAVLPLTGSSASIGEDQRRGIELAVEKINEDGGVLGKEFNVVVEDSAGQANSALDAAKKLTTVDKVPAVMGEYSSGVTVPLGQYLQKTGRVHVNVGSSSPEIADIGDMSFSVIGLDTIASGFAAEELTDRGLENVAVMVPNNSYGEGIAEAFEDKFTAMGGTVTESILYPEGKTSYRAELDRLVDAEPDAILYSAYGQDAAAINQQAYEAGLQEQPWFGVYLTMCTSDSPPETVEGQIGMDVNYIGPAGEDYQSMYEEKYGEGFVSTFNGYTYDATMMLAEAIEKAGSAEPDAIAEAMAELGQGYEGVTGEIALDEQNQRSDQPYLVLESKDGEIVDAS